MTNPNGFIAEVILVIIALVALQLAFNFDIISWISTAVAWITG